MSQGVLSSEDITLLVDSGRIEPEDAESWASIRPTGPMETLLRHVRWLTEQHVEAVRVSVYAQATEEAALLAEHRGNPCNLASGLRAGHHRDLAAASAPDQLSQGDHRVDHLAQGDQKETIA